MPKWYVADEYQDNEAYLWMRQWMEQYDLHRLEWVRLDAGKGRRTNSALWGMCFYPKKRGDSYKISCHVRGPAPVDVYIRHSPNYKNADGSWPPIPEGCKENGYVMDGRSGREWLRLISTISLGTVEEAIVAIMAHEAFHFLRKTKQIDGANYETKADEFMMTMVNVWRVVQTTKARTLA